MFDCVVIGAGAAGLIAARELRARGKTCLVLEARERAGGRVLTVQGTSAGIPIELGAEFVHGEARETMRLLDEARLISYPVIGEHWRVERGKFENLKNMWARVQRVFAKMRADRAEDRSFQQFLETKPGGIRMREERDLARSFIQGFNAADPWRISERALAEQGNPAEGAANAARVLQGYGALIDWLSTSVNDVVRFNNVAQSVFWEPGRARVMTQQGEHFDARTVIMTLPLPFLQDNEFVIAPEVPAMRKAARALVMGSVVRVSVIVRERFWEARLPDDIAFIHTPKRPFNVWWTMHPLRAPVIVGWSGGPPAAELAARGRAAIEALAISELARALGRPRARLAELIEEVHTHDWETDARARGAYSYVGVGGERASRTLSKPVAGTLFFAGEATDAQNSGTVEGALASGRRAARQVVEALA